MEKNEYIFKIYEIYINRFLYHFLTIFYVYNDLANIKKFNRLNIDNYQAI